jgi:putative intracellular protease/amidase
MVPALYVCLCVLSAGPAIFDGLKLSNGQSMLAGKRATGFSPKAEETMNVMNWMKQNSQ